MKIGIVTVAYRLADAAWKLFKSVDCEVDYQLFIHSDFEPVLDVGEWIEDEGGSVYWYKVNRGLSKSWNEGILNGYASGCDVVLVVNDDVVFGAGDVERLAKYAITHRNQYVITCAGWHLHHQKRQSIGYSCFAINPIALDIVGMFDQNIFPIYYEDCDYMWRGKVAGLVEGHCEDTQIEHGGSKTLHTAGRAEQAQHHQTFVANREYYRAKWGGVAGEEVYRHPFNNAGLGIKIEAAVRHNPYGPEYDRVDQQIVRF